MKEWPDFQIPTEWSLTRMDELATKLKAGGTPSRQNKGNFGGNIPFVLIDDMTSSGVYLKSTKERITREGLESCSAWIVPENTVLLSMYATIGATVITTFPVATNQAILAIIPREDCDREYLSFCLQAHKRHLARLNVESTQKNINKGIVSSFPLPLPPLPEQKKIAHILSTVQRAIEAQERIIQTTTELKKALMHKLFTEGLRHEPQKQTEIGPVPESWEVVPLGEFFQIKHGFAFDGKFFKSSGDHILMTPGHFHEEGGFRDQGERTKYFTGEIPQDYVLAKDDLVVAMTEQTSGLLGSAAFVPESDRYLHNQRLGLIVDLDEKRLSKRFLSYVFNHPHLRVEVAKTSTGSKVKHTSPTKLRAVKVGIPPTLDEQEEIASALSTTQQKISVATNKKTQLQDLFRTLLHELMTAKTRVHEIEFSTPNS
jgi:type I restriction enzyme S subunit